MKMKLDEQEAKAWLCDKLRNGYKEYADILADLDFHFTNDPEVTAFLDPRTTSITVNRQFDEDQVLVVVRHEIMHHWLKHEKRLIRYVAKRFGLNYKDLVEKDLKAIEKFIYKSGNILFNYAGDYEISNFTYGEFEKEVLRNLLFCGRKIQGLITEDHHPDWVNLPIEELYDKLLTEYANPVRKGKLVDKTTFVDENGEEYGID